ncbi:helix-turn-helix domain-containing protein [Gluconobacter sphaericus]|uniref:helix-turn-helix domain-containing protein n=1 Tax=Gluconobacter sphaericus TaxID=574987 RepID=UPI001B8CB552|nr:helix-turn-helix domain-containing protein [Gluconobacter sphaericus]
MTESPRGSLNAQRIIPLATLAAPPRGMDPIVARLSTALSEGIAEVLEQERAVLVLSRHSTGKLYLDQHQFSTLATPPRIEPTADVFLLSVTRSALLRYLPMLAALPPLSFNMEKGPGAFLLSAGAMLEAGMLEGTISQTRQRLMQHVTDLLITTILDCLQLEVSVAGRRRHRQKHIRHYIETRLHEHDLTPQSIAEASGISTRALYQLFDGKDGAVAGWILNRRLERIHADLTNPAHDTLSIAQIALNHGFRNAAHFSRRFRQKFGASPREIRQRSALRLGRLEQTGSSGWHGRGG